MGNILVIDDDLDICETLESLATRQGHQVTSAQTIAGGKKTLAGGEFDVIFLDVRLPDGDGLSLLPELAEISHSPEIIILTGKGDPDGAELAIKGGVWDYILKPSSVRQITLTLNRAMRYRQEKQGDWDGHGVVADHIIGESAPIKAACRLMEKASRSATNLLITGDTGTGKEVFARTIHENSSKRSGDFVVVDCASLTESIIESILFGHRKGAFTGAHDNQSGLVKQADQGTLFLDEVGEMPLSMQKAFLRVLQEKSFRAVGDSKEQTSDFRLIAATNRNLDEMVEAGLFRSDLLYRIKTMMLQLPPLVIRRGDIKLLALYKVEQVCEQFGVGAKSVDEDFLVLLEQYEWPGNVRELFNTIERAVVAAGDEKRLFTMHLPRKLRIQAAQKQISEISDFSDREDVSGRENFVRKNGQDIFKDIFDNPLPSLKEFKSMAEKVYLSELIRQKKSNVPQVLKKSGLSRSHFYSLVKKHDLVIQVES